MANKLPSAKNKDSLLIVCEGAEEFDYLNRLKTCGVWSNNFSVKPIDAGSIDKIYATYSYYYKTNSYRLIVIFCDTEKHPYDKFVAMKQKIDGFHGKCVADQIVFFVNPCTLQVVLLHFGAIKLTSNSKCDNAEKVERLTGVKNYDATEQQRRSIVNKINMQNYTKMKQRLAQLKDTYTYVPSSNVLHLFKALEMGNPKWLSEMNQKIER